MKVRILLVSALAGLASNVANATTYFDTIDVSSANIAGNADGPSSGTDFMAQSFSAASANFSKVTLSLSADIPTDGGATMVYLVPDTGSSGTSNVAGSPAITTAGSPPVFGGVAIGDIADAKLSATSSGSPTSLTINLPSGDAATVAAETKNNEYWIALVPTSSSSVEWWYTGTLQGSGIGGQSYFNDVSPAPSTGDTTPLDAAAGDTGYQMIVETPEPASLALLGSGLLAVVYFRRRA